MSEYICDISERLLASVDGIHEGIVRCRDCAKCDESAVCGKMTLFCHHFSMFDSAGFPVEPDGFCKWAERKVRDE